MSPERRERGPACSAGAALSAVARARFEDFVPGRNGELVRRLRELDLDRQPRGLPRLPAVRQAGVGRSHLLQAACHATRRGAIYLPLVIRWWCPELLEG
jgi:DnaA-homolog protein